MEQWSNQACLGYMIMAAEEAGISSDEILNIVRKMHRMHDEVTVDEAARFYRGSDY
ncbi:hypothetical protein [Paenibacillus alvei]|uniref:hypothetical protein n=1 Tax=Paenibacillus alvei TaxID=44250 RepID=UPI00227F1288|nr:hypothetical protein [Paenibacillus alvei]MCY7487262.1 hypothetical protein [Paenibacillus alvei]